MGNEDPVAHENDRHWKGSHENERLQTLIRTQSRQTASLLNHGLQTIEMPLPLRLGPLHVLVRRHCSLFDAQKHEYGSNVVVIDLRRAVTELFVDLRNGTDLVLQHVLSIGGADSLAVQGTGSEDDVDERCTC